LLTISFIYAPLPGDFKHYSSAPLRLKRLSSLII
jgi:hypothetical protein